MSTKCAHGHQHNHELLDQKNNEVEEFNSVFTFLPLGPNWTGGVLSVIFRTFRRKPLGQTTPYFVGMMGHGARPSLSILGVIRFLDWSLTEKVL
jgi:hypothetical protein